MRLTRRAHAPYHSLCVCVRISNGHRSCVSTFFSRQHSIHVDVAEGEPYSLHGGGCHDAVHINKGILAINVRLVQSIHAHIRRSVFVRPFRHNALAILMVDVLRSVSAGIRLRIPMLHGVGVSVGKDLFISALVWSSPDTAPEGIGFDLRVNVSPSSPPASHHIDLGVAVGLRVRVIQPRCGVGIGGGVTPRAFFSVTPRDAEVIGGCVGASPIFRISTFYRLGVGGRVGVRRRMGWRRGNGRSRSERGNRRRRGGNFANRRRRSQGEPRA